MAIDLAKVEAIIARDRAGETIAVCEYFKVTWDTGVVKYYASAAWNELPPFTGIGVDIEPRLLPQNKKDPFHQLELDPDIRTESVSVTFDDNDGEIRSKFNTYGSGVLCEFILYYPDEDLTAPIWSGQLQAPSIYGLKTTKAVASNGNRSRELFVPRRKGGPRECTAIHGARMPDADALRSNLCPYDPANGVGLFKTGSTPFEDCPKDEAGCIARFGHKDFYGGFNTDASAVLTGQAGHTYLSPSNGMASNNKESIPWVFGTKAVRNPKLLLWRKLDGGSNPDHGHISTVWMVCEGPIAQISSFQVNGHFVADEHTNYRLGHRGQARTGYTPDVSNFSSTAIVFNNTFGWINPENITPSDLNAFCVVKGFSEVCVYTGPTTKTRIWTDNGVWCLLEIYKNQKTGIGYAEAGFNIDTWIETAEHKEEYVDFTALFPDGETILYRSRRWTFNAALEGKPIAEQVEDICRSGAISVPFQDNGKFSVIPFRAATEEELEDAPVFTYSGEGRNICSDKGEPMIELSKVPDNKINNEIEVRFEEAAGNGTERVFTVDDPNQKLKAGRQLGVNYFQSVTKKFTAVGITEYAEAVRFGYRLLKFGEFDTGGTDNNLRLTLTVPFEYVLGRRRYSFIKIADDFLDGFTIGGGDTLETPEYFRILSKKKVSGGRCQIVAQAYNRTAYEAFETAAPNPLTPYAIDVINGGSPQVLASGEIAYYYAGQINDKPSYILDLCKVYWTGTQWNIEFNGAVYHSPDDTDYPTQAIFETSGGDVGIAPAPVVRRHIAPPPPGCRLTVGTPSYNPVTKLLVIPIDPC